MSLVTFITILICKLFVVKFVILLAFFQNQKPKKTIVILKSKNNLIFFFKNYDLNTN